jgi:predicted sulfurtransferase
MTVLSASLKVASNMNYIAYYHFFEVKDPQALLETLQKKAQDLELKGSVIVAFEGLNGMLVGTCEQIQEWIAFQKNVTQQNITIKSLTCQESPFKKLKFKFKKELVPVGDLEANPLAQTGKRLTAQELKKWLSEDPEGFHLLDTRNTYEIQAGTFKNAQHPNINHSRSFTQAFKEHFTPSSKPIVMFCTGGIRCEKTTSAALRLGHSEVYQLEGGIFQYLQECGSEHYSGSLFLFDERRELPTEAFSQK